MTIREAAIIVEDVFGKRPEPLNPVDVVLRPAINEALAVVDGVMLAMRFND